MTETWRPVVGFEGSYEVSDTGRVRSLDRVIPAISKTGTPCTRRLRGVMLRPATNRQRGGYRYVSLHDVAGQHQRRVCVLVAAAFIGPRPEGFETCHGDGDPANDRAGNLRYGAPASNAADKKRHGTHQQGEDVSTARLREEEVRNILGSGAPSEALAARYGVHPGHINNIRRGARWGHVVI